MATNLTKIYTRGGDKGKTSLVCGKRVSKNSLRVKTYGSVDELSASFGMFKTLSLNATNKEILAYNDKLAIIQQQLFNIGSLIATEDQATYDQINNISDRDVKFLEEQIDLLNSELKPLTSFTLPGGSMLNAQAHIARTICRRVETQLLDLADSAKIDKVLIQYINRFSDFLFVVSRWVSLKENTPEFLWDKKAQL